ncbi:winged helix-turn-helix transcriptional regulator [Paenibacillus athensensis]|uniref:MarR family transcriptional regulator n=2 Tax=Paenibacillus athensensis TaxID=1967502 RepID=A0A4Y8Q7N7_9BACL|nr:winged helix-turn-helix transcriptional regulator [Paenibacillus athensensis]
MPLSYELVMTMAMSFRLIVDRLHEQLAACGYDDVRPAHGFVFQRLSFGGATGNEIAEHLSVTKQAASQMIEELTAKGYVTRRPHPADSRAKLVELSERGWGCIRETERHFHEIQRQIVELLGAQRAGELQLDQRRILQMLNDGKPASFRPVW